MLYHSTLQNTNKLVLGLQILIITRVDMSCSCNLHIKNINRKHINRHEINIQILKIYKKKIETHKYIKVKFKCTGMCIVVDV